jgi:hypothetical protein
MKRKRSNQRIKSGHKKCEAEYRKFPHAFSYPLSRAQISDEGSRSAHSARVKFGIEGYPPSHHCLREWWWGDPGIGDLSLYDRDGLTIARLVFEDGRYHLRSPISWPGSSWASLDEAKHQAESLALAALPLEPKVATRVAKDNATPHPMGLPVSRQRSSEIGSDWKPIGDGATMPNIPEYLRRARRGRARALQVT